MKCLDGNKTVPPSYEIEVYFQRLRSLEFDVWKVLTPSHTKKTVKMWIIAVDSLRTKLSTLSRVLPHMLLAAKVVKNSSVVNTTPNFITFYMFHARALNNVFMLV